MEFELNAEERALRDAAREFLEQEAPISHAREAMSSGVHRWEDVWKKMAGLGWMSLPFPEKLGGLGMGFVSLSILLTEMGRVVLPGPYLSTMVGGLALGDNSDLIPGLCEGNLCLAIAMDQNDPTVRFENSTVNGEQRFVVEGESADRMVVATPSGMFLADQFDATKIAMLDETRTITHVRFDSSPAELIVGASRDRVLDYAIAALSAEMLGSAERALEIAVEYAKHREQFGKPIGSFQAIKHRAACMKLDVESARNAVWYAAWALERNNPDASIAASTAKAVTSDAARKVAEGCIQIHGGIGFTWEHDAHVFFKRIKVSEALFGDASFHRERVAKLLAERYQTTLE